MNLTNFNKAFCATGEHSSGTGIFPEFVPKEVKELVRIYGGQSFNRGIYRIFNSDQLDAARLSMERVFPEFRGRIVPFGFDWLGRHFAFDRGRVKNGAGEGELLMLEVGAGEAMRIPASVINFHNVELVEYPNDVLAAPFWHRWREMNSSDLAHSECVGYKVPLFLGGEDEITNLEVIDMSVYVEICAQLRNKVRTLRDGQTIASVSMID